MLKNKLIFSIIFIAFALAACNKLKAPVAKFDFQILSGGLVNFVNTSEGTVDQFIWTFGTGDSSTAVSPSFQYRQSGNYTVKLLAINEAGTSEFRQTVSIEIDNNKPLLNHPSFPKFDALLTAINFYSFTIDAGVISQTNAASSLAAFYDQSKTPVNVGSVVLNGQNLVPSKSNYYYGAYIDSAIHSGLMSWSAFGGGGFPTLVESNDLDFPSISAINTTDEWSFADSTFMVNTAENILLADSVMIAISNNNEELFFKKNFAPSDFPVTIDLKDFNSPKVGTATLYLSSFTQKQVLRSGKICYLLNESRTSKEIVFVP